LQQVQSLFEKEVDHTKSPVIALKPGIVLSTSCVTIELSANLGPPSVGQHMTKANLDRQIWHRFQKLCNRCNRFLKKRWTIKKPPVIALKPGIVLSTSCVTIGLSANLGPPSLGQHMTKANLDRQIWHRFQKLCNKCSSFLKKRWTIQNHLSLP